MDEEERLRIELSTLRADHRVLQTRLDGVVNNMSEIREDLDEKHLENRRSIHALRDSLQITMNMIHLLDLKMAKMLGYAIGAGAAVAVISRAVELLWKK